MHSSRSLYILDLAKFSTIQAAPSATILITPSSDKWDDFNYKLLVEVWVAVGGKVDFLCKAKMLVQDEKNTSSWLQTKLSSMDSGMMPADSLFIDKDFLFTLPSAAEYLKLFKKIGKDEAREILLDLNDVGTLRIYEADNSSLHNLSRSEGYRKSLFREDLAFEASVVLEDLFASKELDIPDVRYLEIKTTVALPYGLPLSLSLSFPTTPFGAARISILIGENGIGKTEILRHIALQAAAGNLSTEFFVTREELIDQLSSEFHRVIFVPSALDMLQNDEALNFENKKNVVKLLPGPASKEGWNNVTEDLLTILRGASERNNGINNYEILRRALDEYLNLDMLHLPVELTLQSQYPYVEVGDKKYVQVFANRLNEERFVEMLNSCILTEGPIFLAPNGSVVRQSSGQKSFFALAVALVRNVQKNSLVLIDEPELSLHPKMIASLVRLLDEILGIKKAYCIIATHSLHLIREVPKESVHVIKRSAEEVRDYAPFMQTFGADLSLLATVVFSEDEIQELFEKKIEQTFLAERDKNPKNLLRDLAAHLGSAGTAVLKDHLNSSQNEKN